jgi:hypothetical protein
VVGLCKWITQSERWDLLSQWTCSYLVGGWYWDPVASRSNCLSHLWTLHHVPISATVTQVSPAAHVPTWRCVLILVVHYLCIEFCQNFCNWFFYGKSCLVKHMSLQHELIHMLRKSSVQFFCVEIFKWHAINLITARYKSGKITTRTRLAFYFFAQFVVLCILHLTETKNNHKCVILVYWYSAHFLIVFHQSGCTALFFIVLWGVF